MDFAHWSAQRILTVLALLPVLIACITGLLRFRRLPRNLRTLTVLLLFVLPLNVWAVGLMIQEHNNLFLMPFYTAGEFGLLAIVYRYTLQQSWLTKWLPWLVAGFATYVLVDSLLTSELTRFRPGQQVVQGVLILGFVWLYFRKLLNELLVHRLWQEPMFWVSVGLLIYYLGYLQIALFSNYLLRYSSRSGQYIWTIHSLLFIFLYSCYCRALWLSPPK